MGWQVLLDGMEITQFTYFQQAGGIDLAPITAEITYGLERLTMFLAKKRSVYDIEWAPGHPVRRGAQAGRVRGLEVRLRGRGPGALAARSSRSTRPRRSAASTAGLVLPAYDFALKCSHAFNILDARGAVSATDRVGVIKRVRDLAVECAKAYVASREAQGFPLLPKKPEPEPPPPPPPPESRAPEPSDG